MRIAFGGGDAGDERQVLEALAAWVGNGQVL
jgi:hypothetical protein